MIAYSRMPSLYRRRYHRCGAITTGEFRSELNHYLAHIRYWKRQLRAAARRLIRG